MTQKYKRLILFLEHFFSKMNPIVETDLTPSIAPMYVNCKSIKLIEMVHGSQKWAIFKIPSVTYVLEKIDKNYDKNVWGAIVMH